jgi:hypothetical protein
MKTIICLMISNFIGIGLFAQKARHIPNTNYDYLLIGIDNLIKNDFTSIDKGEIQSSISGTEGTITEEAGDYIVNLSNYSDKNCTLVFKNKKTGEIIKTLKYAIKRVADPTTVLGNCKKSDGSISVGELNLEKNLIVYISNVNSTAPICSIQKFKVIVEKGAKNNSTPPLQNQGADFNVNVNKLIKSVKPGDKIHFYDIEARCGGDSTNRRINRITVTIQ